MVDIVEEAFYVTFDKPFHARERPLNLSQCGMAALVRSEAVGAVGERTLIDGLQNHPRYLLHKLVIP